MVNFKVLWFDSVSSTNDVCMHHASEGSAEGLIVAAHSQTSGRGQRGNIWSSEHRKNLTFSILLRPTFLRVDEQFVISKVVAIALCELVNDYAKGVNVKIKWPNDIYIDNLKVSGVLIENCFSTEFLGTSVVGIGLNVNQCEFPESLPNPTSLRCQTGEDFKVEQVLKHYLSLLNKWYELLQNGERTRINNEYLRLMYRYNLFGTYSCNGEQFMAKIVGVSPIGELMLCTSNGDIKTFAFKEVAFVI